MYLCSLYSHQAAWGNFAKLTGKQRALREAEVEEREAAARCCSSSPGSSPTHFLTPHLVTFLHHLTTCLISSPHSSLPHHIRSPRHLTPHLITSSPHSSHPHHIRSPHHPQEEGGGAAVGRVAAGGLGGGGGQGHRLGQVPVSCIVSRVVLCRVPCLVSRASFVVSYRAS